MVTASLAATTHPHFPIHGSLVSDVFSFVYFICKVYRNKKFQPRSHVLSSSRPDTGNEVANGLCLRKRGGGGGGGEDAGE